MRIAQSIVLTDAERDVLQRWARSVKHGRLTQRARIVLLAAEGWQNNRIAAHLTTDPQTVGRWRARFASSRLAGITQEAPRSGRSRQARESVAAEIIRRTRRRKNSSHPCSCRELARELHISHMLVYRVWKDHGLIENSDVN